MPKLKDVEIKQEDIQEFLYSTSDFAFEMQVLKMMNESGCQIIHGGTYSDPVTGKDREFDIRASYAKDNLLIKMAVECKNLYPNYPLVVSGRSRMTEESYHCVCFKYTRPARAEEEFYTGNENNYKRIVSIAGEAGGRVEPLTVKPSGLYSINTFIGKSCARVGRLPTGEITSNDSEIYDKWSQAVSSAYRLLEETLEEIEASPDNTGLNVILPVLIVPDERLWFAEYDDKGILVRPPAHTDRCQYYLGKNYYVKEVFHGFNYGISHLEIMTTSGLKKFLDDEGKWETIFPEDRLRETFDER